MTTTGIKARLALEDGRVFACRSFTGHGHAGGEVVFNTSMSGYQEILTDPSYRGQLIAMTYPLIGNYGVNPEDVESDRIQAAAFLMREYQPHHSNWRADASLADYLGSQGVMGIEGLDTRALTRHLRSAGAMRAIVSTAEAPPEALVAEARALPSMIGLDLAQVVSAQRPYRWREGRPQPLEDENAGLHRGLWRDRGSRPAVVAIDFGIKYNILRCLEATGFEVLVVPARTGAAAIRQLDPDGIFLSNGPGDPEPVDYAIDTIGELLDYKPIFGICLGHQLIGLALGGRSYKLKFGHRGANQPVKDLRSGRVEITSQNHGFAVDADSLDAERIEVTHINLNDQTLEGFRHRHRPLLAIQYHPEASPGPHDAHYLFDEFHRLVLQHRR